MCFRWRETLISSFMGVGITPWTHSVLKRSIQCLLWRRPTLTLSHLWHSSKMDKLWWVAVETRFYECMIFPPHKQARLINLRVSRKPTMIKLIVSNWTKLSLKKRQCSQEVKMELLKFGRQFSRGLIAICSVQPLSLEMTKTLQLILFVPLGTLRAIIPLLLVGLRTNQYVFLEICRKIPQETILQRSNNRREHE